MVTPANSAILCSEQVFAMSVAERYESKHTALEEKRSKDLSVPKAPVSEPITIWF